MSNIYLINYNRAKYFCAYMKNKLRDIKQETQLLALDFLDYSMDDGKMPLWTQVSSKDFLSSLVNLLKTRDAPEVNNKILFLIEKWGKKFEKYNTIIPGFSDIYIHLRDSGIQFPQGMKSTYSKYIMTEEAMSVYNNNPKNYTNDFNEYDNTNYQNDYNQSSGDITGNSYVNSINLNLKPSSYEKKYKKLVEKLSTLTKEIGMANEYIDKSRGGSYDPTLLTIIDDLKSGNHQLIETIQSDKLKSEKLMEITLGVSDEINRTRSRFSVLKKRGKPEPFLSSFIEKIARTGGNDYGYSKPSYSNDSYKPSKEVNLLETFDNPQIPVNNVQPKPQANTVNDLLDIFSNPQPVQQQQEAIPQNNGPYPNFMNNNNMGNVGGINMDLQLGFGNVPGNNNTNNMMMTNLNQPQPQPQNDLFSALSGNFGQNNNNMNMMNTNPMNVSNNINTMNMNTNMNSMNNLNALNTNTNSFGMNTQPSNPNPMDFNFSMRSQPKPQPISNTNNIMNITNNQPQNTNFDFSMPKPVNNSNYMTQQPQSTNMGTSNLPQQNTFNTSINTMGLNMNYNTQQPTTNASTFSLGMMPNQNKDINFNFSMPTTNTNMNNQPVTQNSNVLDSLF